MCAGRVLIGGGVRPKIYRRRRRFGVTPMIFFGDGVISALVVFSPIFAHFDD